MRFVHDIAERVGFPADAYGSAAITSVPTPGAPEPAEAAMAKAEELVAQYVAAGFPQDPPRLLDGLRR